MILRLKAFVSILSPERHDAKLESTPKSLKKLLPSKLRELDIDRLEYHIVRSPMRLAIPAHTQSVAQVITVARSLVYVESRTRIQIRRGVRLTNGVHEVDRNQPFEIVLANFSRFEHILSKNMVIGVARLIRWPSSAGRNRVPHA